MDGKLHDSMSGIETGDQETFFTFDLHLLRITGIIINIININSLSLTVFLLFANDETLAVWDLELMRSSPVRI